MYRYLALYSPKYTNLTDEAPVTGIVLCRKCMLLLQRASFKDVDRSSGPIKRIVATIHEQREYVPTKSVTIKRYLIRQVAAFEPLASSNWGSKNNIDSNQIINQTHTFHILNKYVYDYSEISPLDTLSLCLDAVIGQSSLWVWLGRTTLYVILRI